jgi:hypothetical protein
MNRLQALRTEGILFVTEQFCLGRFGCLPFWTNWLAAQRTAFVSKKSNLNPLFIHRCGTFRNH